MIGGKNGPNNIILILPSRWYHLNLPFQMLMFLCYCHNATNKALPSGCYHPITTIVAWLSWGFPSELPSQCYRPHVHFYSTVLILPFQSYYPNATFPMPPSRWYCPGATAMMIPYQCYHPNDIIMMLPSKCYCLETTVPMLPLQC